MRYKNGRITEASERELRRVFDRIDTGEITFEEYRRRLAANGMKILSDYTPTRLSNLRKADVYEIARMLMDIEAEGFCNGTYCPYWSADHDECPFIDEDEEEACLDACVNWLESPPEGAKA